MQLGNILNSAQSGISMESACDVLKSGIGANIDATARSKRIRRGRHSIRAFAQTYFGHHCPLPFGEHHEDLFQLVESKKACKRAVRGEPREHGKSTIMLIIVPAWWLAYERKWFTVLFGASHLALLPHFSALQEELDPLTGNELLLSDFPHLRPAIDFKGQFVKWDDRKMVFQNGATVSIWSIHSRFRGLKEKHRRPDAVIIDDPQDEDDISTTFRRKKLLTRVRRTLLTSVGPNCDIYLLGNLMDDDSLLANMLRDPLWNAKLYRAENLLIADDEQYPIGNTKQDGLPLWPEAWPEARLKAREQEVKAHAYAIEMLNLKRAADDIVFDVAKFQRFNIADFTPNGQFRTVLFWDPAMCKKGSRDPDSHGISVVAMRRFVIDNKSRHVYFVLFGWAKVCTPEAAADVALKCMTQFPITQFVYEDNGGFGMIRPYLERIAKERGIALPYRGWPQTRNKVQKIMAAQPVIENDTFFSELCTKAYFDQWRDLFLGHDDGPDSTVSAIEYLRRRSGAFVFGG